MKEAGLYIHVPFCRSKCAYCAFNSIAAEPGRVDDYLDLLAEEMSSYAELAWSKSRIFSTIFIGGGTPSLASASKLAEIVSQCRSSFHIAEEAEVSMEANPDSIDGESLTVLRRAGVNRLSIGVQSFNDSLLATLNRVHTGQQALTAFNTAREAGFANINLDLIYGLPDQTLGNWQDDLGQAVKLGPEHLALYELTVEPGTPFAGLHEKGRLSLPAETMVEDMEDAIITLLSPAYQRYEISNYARPGFQCRHNVNYWQNGSYLGLGAGAVSCLDGLRLSSVADPNHYMHLIKSQDTAISHAECLAPKAQFRESMIMGLRLVNGIDIRALENRLQLSATDVYGNLLADLKERGMLIQEETMVRLPPQYLAVANQVLTKLV